MNTMDIMEMMKNNEYLAFGINEDFNKTILSMMIHYDYLSDKEQYDLEFEEFEFNQFSTFLARDIETDEFFHGFSFPKAILLDEQLIDFLRTIEGLHNFNLVEWAEENNIDVLVAMNMFSLLHEVGHVFNSTNMPEVDENKDEMLEELENSDLTEEEKALAYRQLPFEMYADIFAIDMMNIYTKELVGISQYFENDFGFSIVELYASSVVEG